MKSKQVVINEFDSAEVMHIELSGLPLLKPDEVLVKHAAVGFNFIDVYQRKEEWPRLVGQDLGFYK